MNHLFRFFAVGCLLTAAQVFAAGAFEGRVSLAITAGAHTQEMNYSMKGRKLRMDMTVQGSAATDESSTPKSHSMLPSFLTKKHQTASQSDQSSANDPANEGKKQVSTIMDMEKMEMIMLMPEQKMYMVMPIKQPVGKAMTQANQNGAMAADVELTGKKERILGYTCEQILVTDKTKGTVTELWVAKDLGAFMGLGSGGGGPFAGRQSNSAAAAKWEEVLKGHGGFPLRVVSRDADGKQTFMMEATKIDPGSQPDSLFVPPEGYEKFQMPNFGGLNPFKQN